MGDLGSPKWGEDSLVGTGPLTYRLYANSRWSGSEWNCTKSRQRCQYSCASTTAEVKSQEVGRSPAPPSPPPRPHLLPKRIPLDGAVSSKHVWVAAVWGRRCHKVRALWRHLPSGIKGPRTRFRDEWNTESKLHFNDQRITEQRRPNSIVKVIKDINNISARYQSGEGVSPSRKIPCFPLKPRRFSNSYSWNFLIKPN